MNHLADTPVASWITANDPDITHVRVIDRGASGEVHELLNTRTGQAYARKVIHIFGDCTMANVENELRAIEKLRNKGLHKNIVEIFKKGELSYMSLYFIDMELCDLNLQVYINRHWTSAIELRMPFFTIDLPPRMKQAQMWSIMEDITNGVVFIHSLGEVHRDLKPLLYSCASHSWKIADFGFTVEGTSKSPHTTMNAAGTPSYRAPELVRGVKFIYTNKVDIWALGCIFYEIIYREKAFDGDFAVREYSFSGKLEFPSIQTTLNTSMELMLRLIHEMLDRDPAKRPRAIDIQTKFNVLHIFQTQPVFARNVASQHDELSKSPSCSIPPEPNVQKTQTCTSEIMEERDPQQGFISVDEHKSSTVWDLAVGKILYHVRIMVRILGFTVPVAWLFCYAHKLHFTRATRYPSKEAATFWLVFSMVPASGLVGALRGRSCVLEVLLSIPMWLFVSESPFDWMHPVLEWWRMAAVVTVILYLEFMI